MVDVDCPRSHRAVSLNGIKTTNNAAPLIVTQALGPGGRISFKPIDRDSLKGTFRVPFWRFNFFGECSGAGAWERRHQFTDDPMCGGHMIRLLNPLTCGRGMEQTVLPQYLSADRRIHIINGSIPLDRNDMPMAAEQRRDVCYVQKLPNKTVPDYA